MPRDIIMIGKVVGAIRLLDNIEEYLLERLKLIQKEFAGQKNVIKIINSDNYRSTKYGSDLRHFLRIEIIDKLKILKTVKISPDSKVQKIVMPSKELNQLINSLDKTLMVLESEFNVFHLYSEKLREENLNIDLAFFRDNTNKSLKYLSLLRAYLQQLKPLI